MSVASSTIFIRPAAVFDAEAMAAIHRACFARNWSADEIAQFVSAPGCLSLLASLSLEQAVQGFLIARGAGDEAEILTLAVDPSHRRQGLARALLTAAIDALRKAGAKWLFLEVDWGNESHAAFINRSEPSPWGAVRAIMSMAPTRTSSVLPFEARLKKMSEVRRARRRDGQDDLTGKPDRAPLRRAGDAHDRSAPGHRQGSVGG